MQLRDRQNVVRLGREAVLVAVGQAMAAIGAVVAVRVLTGLLPPAEYGTVALALTFATLTQSVLFAAITAGPQRFLMAAVERNQLAEFSKATRDLLLTALGVFFLASATIFLVVIAFARARLTLLSVASVFFALAIGVGSLLDALQGAARQRAIVAFHSGAGQWLRVGCALLLARAFGASSGTVMFGLAVAAWLVLISQSFFLLRFLRERLAAAQTHGNPGDVPRWRKEFLRFGWPFAVWGPATWLQGSADRWAIEGYVSRSSVGYYATAYQIGYQPLLLISNVVLQLIGPIAYQWAGDASDRSRVQRAHRLVSTVVVLVAGLTVAGVMIGFFGQHLIFGLLVDARYASAAWMLPWLIGAAGLFFCGQVAALYQLSAGNARSILKPKVATALIGAALNMIGAAALGLFGVVLANVAFGAVYCFWMLIQRRED